MSTLDDEVKLVRAANPSWDFQTAWNYITKTQPWRFAKSVEMNRLEAKLTTQKQEEAQERFAKVESIAQGLMARDRRLTFGAALERVRLCLPRVQAEIEELVRPKSRNPEPKKFVEAGNEEEQRAPHPGQAAEIAKGQLLIEGGFCTPVLRKG